MKTLFATLVRLFPASFRARFGAAVVEHALSTASAIGRAAQ